MMSEEQIQQGQSPKSRMQSEMQSSRAVAFKSIQKGIRKNDVSLIIGQSNRGISLARDEIEKFDEIKEVHTNLAQLRKQNDDYRTQSMVKEKELQRFKDENNKLKLLENSLISTNTTVSSDLLSVKQEFDQSKQRFEDTVMTKKSYNHILNRLKHDLICFQLKQNQLDSTLKHQLTNQQYTDFKQKQSVQYNAQTQKLLDEMMKNIELEHRSREDQLSMFKKQIKMRQEAERKRDDRFTQQMEIAEHALYDKDANEKKWRKLLLVHKFLHCLLKNKMEKEMKKFSVVERAFQKIKTATGISEAQLIVQKFLNKEQAYGDLLGKIATSEKKIDYLKRKNETLKNNLQKFKDEVQVMEMGKPQKKGEESDMYKELSMMDDKAKRSEVMAEKLFNWSIKILQRMEKVENPIGSARTNYYEKFPRDKAIDAFTFVHQNIMQKVNGAKQDEIERVMDDLNRSKFKDEMNQEEFLKRNVRVKFKKPRISLANKSFHSQSRESFTKESNKTQSIGGSSGGGSQYEDSSDDDVDENYEADYIGNMRSDMKNMVQVKKQKKEKDETVKKSYKTQTGESKPQKGE